MRVEVLASIAGAPVPRAKGGFVHPLMVRGGDGVGPELIEAYSEAPHPAFKDDTDLNVVYRCVLDVGQRSGQSLDDAGRARNWSLFSVRLLAVHDQRPAQTARTEAKSG